MNSRISIGAALTIVALGLGQARADNLVINGGFETGDFTGWNAQGNYLFVADNAKAHTIPPGGYGPHTGTYYAALGSTGNGSLSQSLATTVGQAYSLSFYLAGDGGTPNSFGVTWGGQTIMAPSVIGGQNYTLYSFMLTANSPTTVLAFQQSDPAGYLALDDVSVSTVPNVASVATAPEPASVTLLALGGLAVAGYGVRRRRQAAG